MIELYFNYCYDCCSTIVFCLVLRCPTESLKFIDNICSHDVEEIVGGIVISVKDRFSMSTGRCGDEV